MALHICCRSRFWFTLVAVTLLATFECTSASMSADLCGTDQAWTYSPLASSCFASVVTPGPGGSQVYQVLNQTEARRRCGQMGPASRLPQPASTAQLDGLQLVLSQLGFGAEVWVGAGNASGTFTWLNGSDAVASSLWLPPGSSGGGDCVIFQNLPTAIDAVWSSVKGLVGTGCASEHAVVCEKPVAKCSPAGITNFTSGTMKATNVTNGKHYDNLFNVGLQSALDCLPGFFRARDSPKANVSAPVSSNGQSVNTALCTYSMSGGAYSPVVQQGSVEQCNPIRCATDKVKTEFRIPNVEPYDAEIPGQYFNYSQKFNVTCSRGYVSYKDPSAITSPVECGQNYLDPTLGEWIPFDLNTCQPVKCPDIAGIINAAQAVAYKADNRINQKQYTEFQSSSYPYYPNRVYVKCRTLGYFFDDRDFEKTVSCDLQNGSLTEGAWAGILGTKLALLKTTECIEVSCNTDILVPRTDAGLAMLLALNYEPTANIRFANGTLVVTNATRVNEQELLPFSTVVTFSCPEGMATGTGEPIALCRSSGDWNLTTLPTCTKVSGRLETKGKFYVPPALEAAAAGSVGALAITISVLFGISLLMLDLSTLSRDVALMRRNLRQLRRRIAAGPRR